MLEPSPERKAVMRPRFRSLTPPLITILVLSAGGAGCQTRASRERARLAEESARRQAETEPPTEEVLGQVRAACEAFMKERHPDQTADSFTFTALTPNLFLVGASVRDPAGGPATVRQLSAERLRDVEESWFSGTLKESGDLLWVVDDLDEVQMKALAIRHGLNPEVDAVRDQDPGNGRVHSWGHRSWLDDYLLWHYLFHRPAPVTWAPGSGYRTQPRGYRFQDPAGGRIQPEDARAYQSAAAATGGRSSVFLGGGAWRPPLASQAGTSRGRTFVARGAGITHLGGRSFSARGGFGSAGRSAGMHFGG
jgi:hypothetical protein